MRCPTAVVVLLLVSCLAGPAAAETGEVLAEEKISSTQGGLVGPLHNRARFGSSVASLGDLDGDGNIELAVGASRYDPNNAGAVWILFLDPNGRVGSEQRIAEGVGGFDAALGEGRFGSSVAALGDLDGDGTTDLLVGEERADAGGLETGSIWLLFLDPNGRVRSQREITAGQSGFGGPLAESSRFGSSVASLGDLDGDGSIEIAVGAPGDPNGVGTVWLLSLDPNGSVLAEAKIGGQGQGGFGGTLDRGDRFGHSLGAVGDIDGDGTLDLAVGAIRDDDGDPNDPGSNRGAVWLLFLDPNGPPWVKAEQKLSASAGGFAGILDPGDLFGSAVAALGDLDSDGGPELAIGARNADDGDPNNPGSDRGAVWILSLDPDGTGTVISERRISETEGGLLGGLTSNAQFGSAVAAPLDLDGDGRLDLVVGARRDDDGGNNRGSLWILFLDGNPCGNGTLDPGEQCEDGNQLDGDGCSARCFNEVVQSKDKQKCVVEMNKNFAKVAKARGKVIGACIKDGAKGKLLPGTIEACSSEDPKGKVTKARTRTASKETAKCIVPPDFGYTASFTLSDAAEELELSLVHRIFGSDLDFTIINEETQPSSIAKDQGKCQGDTAKQARKCLDTRLKEFTRCKKNGLRGDKTAKIYPGADDPFDSPADIERCLTDLGSIVKSQAKIDKVCDAKLGEKLQKRCSFIGASIPGLFRGECNTSTGLTIGTPSLRECLDRLVRCEVCLGINAADGLAIDCDLFDNAAEDRSCP